MTKREKNIEILKGYANEWGWTIAEVAYEFLDQFYQAAGFNDEWSTVHLAPLTESELIDMICDL